MSEGPSAYLTTAFTYYMVLGIVKEAIYFLYASRFDPAVKSRLKMVYPEYVWRPSWPQVVRSHLLFISFQIFPHSWLQAQRVVLRVGLETPLPTLSYSVTQVVVANILTIHIIQDSESHLDFISFQIQLQPSSSNFQLQHFSFHPYIPFPAQKQVWCPQRLLCKISASFAKYLL